MLYFDADYACGVQQNQAIAQNLGILGGKVTSMTGLKIQKYLLKDSLRTSFFFILHEFQ